MYDAVRTPFGKFGSGLAAARPDDLAAHVITDSVKRAPALDPERIDEVVFGNANGALYQVVLVRVASCQRTKNYVAKHTAEGKSKREIMRCLKRHAAREIYRQITNPRAAPDNTDLRQMRTTLGCTITTAARELGQWPSKISLLERGLLRNDDLAKNYRQWLTQQSTQDES